MNYPVHRTLKEFIILHHRKIEIVSLKKYYLRRSRNSLPIYLQDNFISHFQYSVPYTPYCIDYYFTKFICCKRG
jgi:hypothetical protein